MLHSITGILVWVFLTRRCMLSILHAVFDVFHAYDEDDMYVISKAVRRELKVTRPLLILCYADVGRRVLPVITAQDAEGVNDSNLGGWGVGAAVPQNSREVVQVALQVLSRSLPKDEQLVSSKYRVPGLGPQYSDTNIPDSWTNGETRWRDLMARAHLYPEAIHIYEAHILVRSYELMTKLTHTHVAPISSPLRITNPL